MEIAKDTKSRAFEEQFLVYTTLTLVSKSKIELSDGNEDW
jgi:ATP-dependent helicase/nuclease subunit B